MKHALALILIAPTLFGAAAIRPQQLRSEYRANPQGIDVTDPRLSWVLAAADAKARGLRQTAYRVIVASSDRALGTGAGDLWDTGKVVSDQSAQVVYRGKPLTSGAAAFWKVQVWDQAGQPSDWSAPAQWSMGLLHPQDWQAKWIGRDEPAGAVDHRLAARLLRKEFQAPKQVRRATVYYSGLGLSELYLNGAKVGDHVLSPGLTDYDKHVLYVTFDVTKQIAAGRNAIGLMLGNGRYRAPRLQANTRNFGDPKAILRLDVEYEDGSRSSVVSDGTWKLSTAGPIRANNEYDGEEYDARMEQAGWNRAAFDDSKWQPAHIVAAPAGVLSAQMAEPLRVTETLRPISVKMLKPGVYVFDMGQNMVGWCRLRVSGPKGTQITLRHAETLQPNGSLYIANLRTARVTDLYTLKGEGAEVWEPRFTYHGFRFVEMTGFPGTPGVPPAGPAALEGRVVHDDMEKSVDFTSSNTLLNQIHHNMFWGIRGNYRSIPTDCPQRDERQGWLGDRSQVSRSEACMFDVAAFYTKWMTDIADSQKPDGSIPVVSPNYWPNYYDDLTWPGTFIFVHGMLYDEYGDKRAMERNYPAMKKWIDHEATFLKDGLMPKDKYGDWCVPPEDPKLIHSVDPARITDPTLLGSSYYYQLLRTMSRYARLLDKSADAADFDKRAEQVNAAFQSRFFKPANGIYDNGTQTSSILPLYFNMVPPEDRAAVFESLTRNIQQTTHGHVGTGLVGAQWLMRTLTDNGRADVAYQIATQKTYPGWGYMVQKGATTIWELWNGDTADPAMNSGNHVMQIGDLAVWMYEDLAGIRSDADRPGFKRVIIHPIPAGDLTFVKASHKSMYGAITTSWKRDGAHFTLEVTIPPNTSALVTVPAKDPAAVTESGRPVKYLRIEPGAAVYEVPSGTYTFASTF
jgi:alpha-L-rhamnosidase